MQAMLVMKDTGALLRFVQRPNAIDLAEGEAALRIKGRYSELVSLLKDKNRHAAALEILKKVSQRVEDLPVPPQGPPFHSPSDCILFLPPASQTVPPSALSGKISIPCLHGMHVFDEFCL